MDASEVVPQEVERHGRRVVRSASRWPTERPELRRMLGWLQMWAIVRCVLLALTMLAGACNGPSSQVPSIGGLVFLTRDGCANTATMRTRLDETLREMGLSSDYQVLDVATLATSDPRRAYPTPTVLYSNGDLFGMPAPRPPYPAPT